MTYHEIERPPMPTGEEKDQIRQIYRYLYRLSEQLENVINSITKGDDGE